MVQNKLSVGIYIRISKQARRNVMHQDSMKTVHLINGQGENRTKILLTREERTNLNAAAWNCNMFAL